MQNQTHQIRSLFLPSPDLPQSHAFLSTGVKKAQSTKKETTIHYKKCHFCQHIFVLTKVSIALILGYGFSAWWGIEFNGDGGKVVPLLGISWMLDVHGSRDEGGPKGSSSGCSVLLVGTLGLADDVTVTAYDTYNVASILDITDDADIIDATDDVNVTYATNDVDAINATTTTDAKSTTYTFATDSRE
uniref:Uncharacterized protein n=1 Tax=Cannabis sativa TaxID=3483 RepID=A0A803NLU0_CANSA